MSFTWEAFWFKELSNIGIVSNEGEKWNKMKATKIKMLHNVNTENKQWEDPWNVGVMGLKKTKQFFQAQRMRLLDMWRENGYR